MKLAVVLPADQPPADHLAAYYDAQSDGRWVLQIDQPPPVMGTDVARQGAADKAESIDATSHIDATPADIVPTDVAPADTTMVRGGGAGQLDDLAPASIAANDIDAINQNLPAIATGRLVLSS